MSQLQDRLKSTATGLDLLVIGFGVVIAGVMVGYWVEGFQQQGIPPEAGPLVRFVAPGAGYILSLVGLLLFLRAPVNWLGKVAVIAACVSVLLSLVNVSLTAFGIAIEKELIDGDPKRLEKLNDIVTAIAGVFGVLFVLFLRQLAITIQSTSLAGWFLHAFLLSAVCAILFMLAQVLSPDRAGDLWGGEGGRDVFGSLVLGLLAVSGLVGLFVIALFFRLRKEVSQFLRDLEP